MRITSKILESLANHINKITNSSITPYTGNKANIGNYNIGCGYNSVSLHRMSTIGGGVDSIYGPCSNRELYHFMTGYIRGFGDGKE